uniref:Uncharacterized protein n=1 Tax=viral metagenome TaxID=1070528 RepID=A0A6H1ZES5_9ZZZZ
MTQLEFDDLPATETDIMAGKLKFKESLLMAAYRNQDKHEINRLFFECENLRGKLKCANAGNTREF